MKRIDGIKNKTIRKMYDSRMSLVERVSQNITKWFGHMLVMNEGIPIERRNRSRCNHRDMYTVEEGNYGT